MSVCTAKIFLLTCNDEGKVKGGGLKMRDTCLVSSQSSWRTLGSSCS